MSNDFETITRFLDRYGDDVEGRELDEIPPHLKPKLRDFALALLMSLTAAISPLCSKNILIG